jgi:hypothetical protein
MRKLKLALDELKVESFSVSPPDGRSGTVHGRNRDTNTTGPVESVDACETVGTCMGPTYCCAATWEQTCAQSCYQTAECGDSCWTWWCSTCNTCQATCEGGSCTDICANCSA